MANRNSTFLLKRSNVSGKVPALSGLTIGELALNVADSKLYSLYTGGLTGATEVREIGWDRLSIYGGTLYSGLTINGDLTVTGLTQTKGITSTGGITFKQITINSTYTATTEDYMIDVTGGTFTVYLPSAIGIQGRLIVIKNNGGGAVTVQPILGQNIDDKPFVTLGETNTIQLVSNGSNWVAISYNISTVNSSTGVFEFSGLTTSSPTTFNVAPIKGWIVDDTTNPLSPQLYYISYSGGTHTDTYVNTSVTTWIYLNSSGIISQLDRPLSEQERRENIFLGKISHPNKTSIDSVLSQPDYVLSPLSQLRDMFTPINLINGGIRASANGSNLSFNTSSGYLYGLGINFSDNTLNPNTIYISGTSPCTFQYRTQTGGTSTNVTSINPLNYDNNGIVTPVTGTKATNQRIYLLQNGDFRVQYGQVTYATLALAVAGLGTEQFVEFSNHTTNGILIGVLSILSTVTSLSDTSKALFFNVSKFGDSSGAAGGTPTTTLQQAYNNSVNPEIITNTMLNGVQFRSGTGNDDDKNIIIETNAGAQTAWVTASGDSKFHSVSAETMYTNWIDFNQTASVPTVPGRVSWDSGTGTLNIGIGDSGTTTIDLQVGQEEIVRVYNSELTTLLKGEIVYVVGSSGNRPSVKRALATSDGYSVTTLGMVADNITSASEGYVTTFGIISNLNTIGLTGGTPVFLSPTTPGAYTSVKPQAPDHIVLLGYVVRPNSATVGSIFINISNGWELDELHDTRISGVSTGDLLMRSSYSGTPVWVNTKTLLGDYTINGNLSITGDTTINNLSANTISATTYYNLPTYKNSIYDKLGVVTATTIGDNFNTGIKISQTPYGYVDVTINGLGTSVGDGITNLDSYFSSDGLSGGVRSFSSITANDFFVWNGTIAGYDLDSGDTISFYYIIQN
jgi:hypothetical protein